jgi:hypothetical protein
VGASSTERAVIASAGARLALQVGLRGELQGRYDGATQQREIPQVVI